MGRILGIDYGEARIGLALSDENKRLALSHKTLPNKPGVLDEIEKVIKENHVEKVVIGLPLLLTGKESPMCAKIRTFAEKIQSVPVDFIDERFTSECAHSYLKEVKLKRKKRAKMVDYTSATILLQDYLDRL